MGYGTIAELSHRMEDLMDRVRKNEITLDSSAIDVLFECLDTLEKMVETPEKSSEIDIASLIGKLSRNDHVSVPLKDEQIVQTNASINSILFPVRLLLRNTRAGLWLK